MKGPTYITPFCEPLLDLLITSVNEAKVREGFLNTKISDSLPISVFVDFKIFVLRKPDTLVVYVNDITLNLSHFNKRIRLADWGAVFPNDSVDGAYEQFPVIICNVYGDCIFLLKN